MDYNKMQDIEVIKNQYKDDSNLEIRKSFHKKYSTNTLSYNEWIISNIDFSNDCRILEVGCGTGNLWKETNVPYEKISKLILTDISEGMVNIAKTSYHKNKKIQCINMDVLNLPYVEKSFDIIIANSMLYHVKNIELALKNIYKILKTNGVFYVTTFSENGLIKYLEDSVVDMGLVKKNTTQNLSFTLENGKKKLLNYFNNINLKLYDDQLKVTNSEDIVDYIYSMSSMSELDTKYRYDMIQYFKNKENDNHIIEIPKLYGMFICKKESI